MDSDVNDYENENFIKEIEEACKEIPIRKSECDRKRDHSERLRKIMKLENISSIESFAAELGVDPKTLGKSTSRNPKQFLNINFALEILERYNHSYSLDWIYGLSDVMENKDRGFIKDIREMMRIETKKRLFLKDEKVTIKDVDVLVLTITESQFRFLMGQKKIFELLEEKDINFYDKYMEMHALLEYELEEDSYRCNQPIKEIEIPIDKLKIISKKRM
ncbi:hypothetical protein [Lacrimispora sp.]|uniref:hypothetical protein n=1 Tax=Lacrimispora sp. TaxID=2719234 RepID=UPI0028A09B7B|nr:hypothetical protein [Lacrimispora sp.]